MTRESIEPGQVVLEGRDTNSTSAQNYRFDGFISYSRKDASFARSLQGSLERKFRSFSKKIQNGKRHLMLCRDETDFTSAGDLSAVVTERIRESRNLLVICSPESRSAVWVNDEIKCFRETHGNQGNEGIIAILLRGDEPVKETAMPSVLLQNGSEPLAVEFRREKIEPEISFRKYSKDDGLIRILAPIVGIEYPILRNRHQELERKRLKRNSIIFGLLATVFALLSIGIFIFYDEADKQRSKAESTLHDALSGYASAALLNIRNGYPNEASYDLNYMIELAMAVPPDKNPSSALLWYTFVTDFIDLGDAFKASNDMKSAAAAFAKALVIQRWLLEIAKLQSGNQRWNNMLSETGKVLGQKHGKVITEAIPRTSEARSVLAQWHETHAKISKIMERFPDSEQTILEVGIGLMNSGKSYGKGIKHITLKNGKSYNVETYDGVPIPANNRHIRMSQLGPIGRDSGGLQWLMGGELKEKGDFAVTVTTPMDDTLSTSFNTKGPDHILHSFFDQNGHPSAWEWMNDSGTSWIPFSFQFRSIPSGSQFEILAWAKFDSYDRKYLQNGPAQLLKEYETISKATENMTSPAREFDLSGNDLNRGVIELLSEGDREREQGNNAAARSHYEAALKTLETTVKNKTGDAKSRRLLALSYERIGAIALHEHALGEAQSAFERSLTLNEALLRGDPQNNAFESDHMRALMHLGDLHLAQRDVKRAAQKYIASSEMGEKLLLAHPQEVQFLWWTMVSYGKAADATMKSSDRVSAMKMYERFAEIGHLLLRIDSNNEEARRRLIKGYMQMGFVAIQLDDTKAAKKAFLHSSQISEEALRVNPADFEYREASADSLVNIGTLEMRSNHLEEASVLYQRALDLRKMLLQSDPTNMKWLKELLLTHFNMAVCNRKMRNVEATIFHVREGNDVLVKLTSDKASASDAEIARAKSAFAELSHWAKAN